MKVSEVKENLGKIVLYKPEWSNKEQEFILNAYIYRINPLNPNKRVIQVELQDNKCINSVMIAAIEKVKTKDTEQKI